MDNSTVYSFVMNRGRVNSTSANSDLIPVESHSNAASPDELSSSSNDNIIIMSPDRNEECAKHLLSLGNITASVESTCSSRSSTSFNYDITCFDEFSRGFHNFASTASALDSNTNSNYFNENPTTNSLKTKPSYYASCDAEIVNRAEPYSECRFTHEDHRVYVISSANSFAPAMNNSRSKLDTLQQWPTVSNENVVGYANLYHDITKSNNLYNHSTKLAYLQSDISNSACAYNDSIKSTYNTLTKPAYLHHDIKSNDTTKSTYSYTSSSCFPYSVNSFDDHAVSCAKTSFANELQECNNSMQLPQTQVSKNIPNSQLPSPYQGFHLLSTETELVNDQGNNQEKFNTNINWAGNQSTLNLQKQDSTQLANSFFHCVPNYAAIPVLWPLDSAGQYKASYLLHNFAAIVKAQASHIPVITPSFHVANTTNSWFYSNSANKVSPTLVVNQNYYANRQFSSSVMQLNNGASFENYSYLNPSLIPQSICNKLDKYAYNFVPYASTSDCKENSQFQMYDVNESAFSSIGVTGSVCSCFPTFSQYEQARSQVMPCSQSNVICNSVNLTASKLSTLSYLSTPPMTTQYESKYPAESKLEGTMFKDNSIRTTKTYGATSNQLVRKPPCSYIELIATVLLPAETGMVLGEIYENLRLKHSCFQDDTRRQWRNSVRHNLSVNECFVKLVRSGKGWTWGIHPACKMDFQRGNFSRRNARQKVADYYCHVYNQPLTSSFSTAPASRSDALPSLPAICTLRCHESPLSTVV